MKSYLTYAPDREIFPVASLYGDGTSALVLVDEDQQRVVTASTNHKQIVVPWNQLAIKDYSENEGTLKTLVEAKIVEVKTTYHDKHEYWSIDQAYTVEFPIVEIIDKTVIRDLKRLRKQYKVDGATI